MALIHRAHRLAKSAAAATRSLRVLDRHSTAMQAACSSREAHGKAESCIIWSGLVGRQPWKGSTPARGNSLVVAHFDCKDFVLTILASSMKA